MESRINSGRLVSPGKPQGMALPNNPYKREEEAEIAVLLAALPEGVESIDASRRDLTALIKAAFRSGVRTVLLARRRN